MIEVQNLHYKYTSYEKSEGLIASLKDFFVRKKVEMHALDNVSFKISSGEMVGLLGPNGAGKTTLMKILIGLIYPTSGSVNVLERTPYDKDNAFLKKIGIVLGQKSQLIWDLPPVDTFKVLKEIYGISKMDYEERLSTLVRELGVVEKIHTPVRKLSLGERMKCELIASFLHSPTLLLLDEPTIGLDVASQKAIYRFLLSMNEKEKTTIIITSHYMNDIKALSDRLIILLDGKVHYDGKTEELLQEYRKDEIVINLHLSDNKEVNINNEKYNFYKQENVLKVNIDRNDLSQLLKYLGNQNIQIENITSEDAPLEDIIFSIFTREA